MLTKSEILEIRKELDSTKKPFIFFDDDTDGVCSFLLFYKYLKDRVEDVKGIPVSKNSMALHKDMYIKKLKEYSPDKVFILDMPVVSQEFLDDIKTEIKVRSIWLDHHPLQEMRNVVYYNPMKHKSKKFNPDNRPTTYWAYIITNDPRFLWIAMVGCTGDWFIPEFKSDFVSKYPDLIPKGFKWKDPGDVLYGTKLGELCHIFQFNMKNNIQNVNKSVSIMKRIENPHEVFDSYQTKFIRQQYEKINAVYQDIKSRFIPTDDPLMLMVFEDEYSLTGDLSNEILHSYPDKFIIIARNKNDMMACSLRSAKYPVRDILEKSLIGIKGHGGGHKNACGAGIAKDDFDRFVGNLRKNISKYHV